MIEGGNSQYISSMLKELKILARKENRDAVAYLIDLARSELSQPKFRLPKAGRIKILRSKRDLANFSSRTTTGAPQPEQSLNRKIDNKKRRDFFAPLLTIY